MFEIHIKMLPSVESEDIERLLFVFLTSIGYIRYDDENYRSAVNNTGFRLFKALLEHPDKYWSADELIAYLKTTRPTLYRYLNKLKSLDLVEEQQKGMTKGYRIRYGNLSKAWNFVEANVDIAMDNYRKVVERISKLMEG
jgi:predicted transcriptional regulator